MDLRALDPIPTLLSRVRGELGASFDASRPVRVARAPGRLDLMGGIADYTGSLVCEWPISAGTGVALQERADRQVSVFSFNLLDDHRPFQFAISLEALARTTAEALRRDLAAPGRSWAGYIVGCLFLLHEKGLVDVADARHRGLNLAVLSTVPQGAGLSSSAALEVATMTALAGHFDVPEVTSDGLGLAKLCQEVENRIVGAPCGIMDQVTCALGEPDRLLRLLCQPHELQRALALPEGVRVVGLDTGVRHSVGGKAYGRTRAGAFMGHRLILDQMQRLGEQAGKTMTGDPTGGYLARLDPNDYKRLFRPGLPESMAGADFLEIHASHGDAVTVIEPGTLYAIQAPCDHHVLEAQRVRRFARFVEDIDQIGRAKALASAGHLMYASHKSYSDKAGLGSPEADQIVHLVKQHEAEGLFGARITGGGSGGTVAVLMEASPRAAKAIKAIREAFRATTGRDCGLVEGTSPGAAFSESELVNL